LQFCGFTYIAGKAARDAKAQLGLLLTAAACVAGADAQGGSGAAGSVDKFALYQSAVQAPQGDISWMLRFYRQYVGLQVRAGGNAIGLGTRVWHARLD